MNQPSPTDSSQLLWSNIAERTQHRRAARSASYWLLVLLAAWIIAVVGQDGWWKPVGWLGVAVSLGMLATSMLSLATSARRSLLRCTAVATVLALFEMIHPGLSSSEELVLGGIGLGLAALTVLAFGSGMRELARVGGSPRSLRAWRVLPRWQLGVLALLFVLMAFAVVRGTTGTAVEMPIMSPGGLLLVAALFGGLVAFGIAPAVLILRLHAELGGQGRGTVPPAATAHG